MSSDLQEKCTDSRDGQAKVIPQASGQMLEHGRGSAGLSNAFLRLSGGVHRHMGH